MNWTRPLKGPASVLRIPREDQYFADMVPWNNRDSYVKSAELIARSGCDTVGIDSNIFQLEFPLMDSFAN